MNGKQDEKNTNIIFNSNNIKCPRVPQREIG
jgi:hypothetical protein